MDNVIDAIEDEDNWDIVDLDDDTSYIYLYVNERWNLWTSIEKSALISDTEGGVDPNFGYGLFARRRFDEGDYIGKLTGEPLTIEQAEETQSIWILQLDGLFIDTEFGVTGYVQYINDAKETTSTNNCIIADDGFIVASHLIEAGHEILVDYGSDYWSDEDPHDEDD